MDDAFELDEDDEDELLSKVFDEIGKFSKTLIFVMRKVTKARFSDSKN